MNVLHVMPYIPLPLRFGGAIRIYHLLKSLACSHSVHVVAFGTKAERDSLQQHFGRRLAGIHVVPHPPLYRYRRLGQLYAVVAGRSFYSVSTHSQEMQRTIDRIFHRTPVDAVQAEFPFMAGYIRPYGGIRILDAHNVEYYNLERMCAGMTPGLRKIHYRMESRAMRQEELAVCRNQDAILVTSRPDASLLGTDVPSVPRFVIPNGVDTEFFRADDKLPEPHSMVFTGEMGYVPNQDGMLYFLDHIFPAVLRRIPDAKVYIVGSRPPAALRARNSSRVVVTGYVEDVRPFVWRSTLFVVPLRMGGGTRLKVLEAMAMKKPIVTTSIGCEGIDVRHSDTSFVEDDPAQFADRIIQLLGDYALRQRFMGRGYDLVRTQYDWSVISEQLEGAYRSIMVRRMERSDRETLPPRFTLSSSPGWGGRA